MNESKASKVALDEMNKQYESGHGPQISDTRSNISSIAQAKNQQFDFQKR